LPAILFHHSNVEIPFYIERWLCRFIVTPRMHGMHYSMIREEANAIGQLFSRFQTLCTGHRG